VLAMVMDEDRAPVADGVNVTAKEQVPPGTTSPVQVDALIANSAALLLATPEIVTLAPPVLASVNNFAALATAMVWSGNAYVAGTERAPGVAAVVPVPVSDSICGLPVPVLATVIDADRGPTADAVNVTLKLQLAPTATTPEQLELVMANSAALLLVIAAIVTAVPPVLVSVNACGEPAAPTVCVPNA
jgi:hypothetical protein